MKRPKLQKIKRELPNLRRSQVRAADLEGFAKKLGRRKDKRGKEPVWVNDKLPVYPVSIPHHGGRDLPIGTKNNILDSLEEDIFAWEEILEQEEVEENEQGDD